MFPQEGFTDTITDFSGVNHDSALAKIFINPYAAVPSMHCAFALMIGGSGFMVCRRWWSKAWWAFWPILIAWVVIVTGNHYWVDAVLGWLVALAAFVAAVWFVAVPVGFGVCLTHLPSRREVRDTDLGARKQAVTVTGADALRLRGWYVPSRNRAAVIALHGTGSNRLGVERHARMLARHGYGVVIFDRRGEGESDGDPNPYAWNDGERDLLAAIDFLKRRPDVEPDRIGGIGLSVGGETFLQTAAHSEDVKAVVSEGATARSVGELRSVPGSGFGPVALNAAMTAGTAVFSNSTPPPHLVDLVEQITPRSMLLIHSPKDDPDEPRFNRAFYEAAGVPKEIWSVPEAGHVGAQEARPRQYEQRVTRFFDRALGRERHE
jgi:fermentation-respiration switch protein FrsA (DUF1100 family)